MDEKWLFRFALICSLVGVFVVFYMSLAVMDIGTISESFLEQPVRVKGYISEISTSESFYLLTVYDATGSIEAIDFSKNTYRKGQEVTLRGTVSEYDGELQLVLN